jgi:branched-chain amino acid transport system substrate-binding protein
MQRLTASRILIAVVTVGLLAAVSEVACAQGKEPITIGASMAYTGAFAGPVVQWATGWKDYLEQVNAMGGINGRKIVMVEADDEYKAEASLAIYKRLMSAHKIPLFLLSGSPQVAMVYPVAQRQQVPIMTIGAETHAFANPREYPYYFGTVLNTYTDQGRVILRFIKDQAESEKKPLPKVGMLISSQLVWGVETERGFKPYADKLGFKYHVEHIEIGATSAFEQLQRLKEFGAEWLLVFHSPAIFSLAVKNANEIGYKPSITTFHWSLWEPIIESLGPLSDGLILNNAWIPWGAQPDHPGMKKLMSIHQKAGRKDPHTVHYTLGYIKAAITVEALRQAGDNLAAANIKNAFERIRNFEVDGLAPPITISPEDHRGNMTYYFWRVKDKKYVKVGEATLDRREAALEVK